MATNRQKLIARLGAAAVALSVPLVMLHEGTVQRTYFDPIGKITACVGHTGPELRMGQTFSKQQCADMLDSDLLKHADALDCIDRTLTPGQTAAFLSFAFNVGEAKFCSSSLVRKANDGDMAGACAELSRWTYAGGRQLPGLVKRRAAERAICEGEFK